jgi:lysozyme
MKSSDILIEKIKEFEGVKLVAYKCPAGIPTIGVGHTKGVKMGQKISMAQVNSLLRSDLSPIEAFLNKQSAKFTQGQFDALVDFAFNLGIGALSGSSLFKKALAKVKDTEIKNEFMKWTHAAGKVLPGLVKRRQWESVRWCEK